MAAYRQSHHTIRDNATNMCSALETYQQTLVSGVPSLYCLRSAVRCALVYFHSTKRSTRARHCQPRNRDCIQPNAVHKPIKLTRPCRMHYIAFHIHLHKWLTQPPLQHRLSPQSPRSRPHYSPHHPAQRSSNSQRNSARAPSPLPSPLPSPSSMDPAAPPSSTSRASDKNRTSASSPATSPTGALSPCESASSAKPTPRKRTALERARCARHPVSPSARL